MLALAGTNAADTGTITGLVKLLPQKTLEGAAAGRYQVKASTAPAKPEPSTAIVFLEAANPSTNAPSQTIELKQKGFQFQPANLVIQKGTRVEFPNMDDDYHNIFSYSKAKRFDLGRYRKDEPPPSLVFDKAGVIKLYCEIHEHMRGTILVVDTPYFTRTDAEGRYQLANVPPGTHRVKAWQDEKTIWEKSASVNGGETVTLNFDGP